MSWSAAAGFAPEGARAQICRGVLDRPSLIGDFGQVGGARSQRLSGARLSGFAVVLVIAIASWSAALLLFGAELTVLLAKFDLRASAKRVPTPWCR